MPPASASRAAQLHNDVSSAGVAASNPSSASAGTGTAPHVDAARGRVLTQQANSPRESGAHSSVQPLYSSDGEPRSPHEKLPPIRKNGSDPQEKRFKSESADKNPSAENRVVIRGRANTNETPHKKEAPSVTVADGRAPFSREGRGLCRPPQMRGRPTAPDLRPLRPHVMTTRKTNFLRLPSAPGGCA